MTATITLDSAKDSITLTPTGGDADIFGAAPSVGAYIYDDESLDSWYALPKPSITLAKRANAHGMFGLGQTWTDAAEPVIMGRYFGLDSTDAHFALLRLAAMYNDGLPIVMRVTDPSGVTSRVVWVTDFSPDWTATDTFTFSLSMVAPDGRRYGPLMSAPGTGLPTPPSGLVWPLGASMAKATATDTKLVVTGSVETVILSVNIPPNVPTFVTLSVYASMLQPAVPKSGWLRLRDQGTAAELTPGYALADRGDSGDGFADRWEWSGMVTSPSGAINLTGQVNAGTNLYVSNRTLAAGRFFDWGTAGTPGTVVLSNPGNAAAYPSVFIGSPGGAFLDGFRVTEVETGRELVFPFAVPAGTIISVNNRTRRATQDGGGDVTELLSKREWFTVPAGSTRTYLISTLGNVSGAPTFRATMMPAYL